MTLRLLLWFLPLTLATAQTFTISGTVLDADKGSPLNRVRIEIRPQNQQGGDAIPLAVLSTSNGTFQITSVPAGSYFLTSALGGYVPVTLPDKNSWQSLTVSNASIEAKFYLQQEAAAEGTITDCHFQK